MNPLLVRLFHPVKAVRHWLASSIRHRMHWYSAMLASGILVGFGIVGFLFLAHSLDENRAADQAETANLARRSLEWILNGTVRHIAELAADPVTATALTDSSGRDGYLKPWLRDIERHSPAALKLRLTDYKGEVIASSGADGGPPEHIVMARETVAKGKGGAQLVRGGSGPELVILAPVVYLATGYPEGAMVGTVNLAAAFKQATDSMSPLYDYGLFVGDQAVAGAAIPAAQGTRIRLATVAPLDQIGLTLAIRAKGTATNRHFVWLGLAFTLGGALLIVAVFRVSRDMSERLTARLTLLTRAAREVEATGTLALDFPTRQDEVDTLAQALKSLLDRLLANQQQLEQRVRERTRELAESEGRYRLLAENATDWITLLDAAGRYLYVSPVAEPLLGYPAAELVGASAASFVHAQDLARFQDGMAQFQRDGTRHVAYRIRRRDGAYLWVETAGHQARGESGPEMVCVTRDITARMQAEERIRLLANAFEHTAEGIVVTDADQRILSVNRAFREMSGYGTEELLGQTPDIYSTSRHKPGFLVELDTTLAETGEWHGELWHRRKDGSIYPVWLALSTMRDEAGAIVNYIAVYSDMTVRKENEAYVRHLAYYDALTDLPNRSLLRDRLQQATIQSRRNGTLLAAGFLDLDGFKQVNDEHGHDMGDALLREVAQRLLAAVRQGDTVARLGGDEFVVVLPDLGTLQDILPVAEKVLAAVALPYRIHGVELQLTASLGFAVYPTHSEDPDTLLNQADAAMYQAKRLGKNGYRLYSEATPLAR